MGSGGEWWTWFVDAIKGVTWSEIKSTAELLLYFLVVLAVIGCLRRLKLIREIISEFNNARGPIWDLRETINDLTQLEPAIRQLSGQMGLLDAKVDAARKQVAELQVESVSGRTEEADGVGQPNGQLGQAAASTDEEADRNWEKLREFWRRNTRRIEYVIEQIPDGRTRIAYDRLPRTSYRRIVNKLQGAKLISPAAANASQELIDLFNSYRPKNRRVPNSIVGTLELLDRQLDRELADYTKVIAAEADESAEEKGSVAVGPPPVPDMGRPPAPLQPGNFAEQRVT